MAKIRELFFIAYDISNDRRRTQIVKILEDFGVRTQFSLFEFWLTPARKTELLAKLKKKNFLEDRENEGILFIPIPESFEGKIQRYGTTNTIFDEACVYIG